MSLPWQWLLRYEKLTRKVIPTSLVVCIRAFRKHPFPLPSAAVCCVFWYSLKMICKAQRDNKVKHLSERAHMTQIQSEEMLWSIWNLQELRSHVFTLWKATEVLWAAVSPRKTKRLTKLNPKVWSLFHIVVQAEITAWNCCKAFNFQWSFTFMLRQSRGKIWTLRLNGHPCAPNGVPSDPRCT